MSLTTAFLARRSMRTCFHKSSMAAERVFQLDVCSDLKHWMLGRLSCAQGVMVEVVEEPSLSKEFMYPVFHFDLRRMAI